MGQDSGQTGPADNHRDQKIDETQQDTLNTLNTQQSASVQFNYSRQFPLHPTTLEDPRYED